MIEWLTNPSVSEKDFDRVLERIQRLAAAGVTEIGKDSLRMFSVAGLIGQVGESKPDAPIRPPLSLVQEATATSIPEQTGTNSAPHDPKDIFDIIESGVIPGSPRADGLVASDPSQG